MASLKSSYTAPNNSDKTFEQTLQPCSAQPSSAQRTQYLKSLGESLVNMQNDINAFLTQKMEEDNTVAGPQAADRAAKEEETYGEEGSGEES